MVDSQAMQGASRRPLQDDTTALVIQMSERLAAPELSRIQQQAAAATAAMHEGLVFAHAVEVHNEQAIFRFEPVDPGIVRFDFVAATLIERQNRLDASLASALCYAVGVLTDLIHQQGLFHGRIGPQSVLLTPTGSVAVMGSGRNELDGLAFAPHNPLDRMVFQSNERIHGAPGSPADDVFSLGAFYYMLLAGRLPRSGRTSEELRQEAAQPILLPGALPDPRPGLIHVLARALSPNASARFSTGRELAEAIEEEREAAGLPPASPDDVTRLLQGTLTANVPRGGAAVAANAAPSVVSAQPASSPPAGWSNLLPSEDLPASRPASASGASVPVPVSDLSLPGVPQPQLPQADLPQTAPPAPSLPMPKPPSGPTEPVVPGKLPLPAASPAAKKTPSLSGLQSPVDSPLSGLSAPATSDFSHGPIVEGASIKLSSVIALGVTLVALVWVGYAFLSRDSGTNTIRDAGMMIATPPPDSGIVKRPQPPAAGKKDAGVAKQVHLLTVMSQPSGAVVEVDGGYVGVTPLVLKHRFEQRAYEVRVSKKGYNPWSSREVPKKNGSMNLTVALEQHPE